MSIRVGSMRRKDLPEILVLLEECGLPSDELEEHLATVLAAQEGERVVGSATLEIYGTSALLRSVAVQEGLRDKGLGQRLIRPAQGKPLPTR